MNLSTAWKMVRDRLAGSQQETPKKRRQPRQPKTEKRIQRTIDDAFLDTKMRELDLSLVNHHNRISELEQINKRRLEYELEQIETRRQEQHQGG